MIDRRNQRTYNTKTTVIGHRTAKKPLKGAQEKREGPGTRRQENAEKEKGKVPGTKKKDTEKEKVESSGIKKEKDAEKEREEMLGVKKERKEAELAQPTRQ